MTALYSDARKRRKTDAKARLWRDFATLLTAIELERDECGAF
jgi:hypothetical protein